MSAKPFCCPRCKTPVGYVEENKLHIEINGRTFIFDGVIRLTCPRPCNQRWIYRKASSENEANIAKQPMVASSFA